MSLRRVWIGAAALALASLPLEGAAAASWTDGTADWNTAGDWDSSTVPDSTTGIVVDQGDPQISGGYAANTAGAEVGKASGNTGTITVTGTGSSWTIGSTLHVGESGTGTVAVSGGAAVTSDGVDLGDNVGGNGTITIDGSHWTDNGAGRGFNLVPGAVTVGGAGWELVPELELAYSRELLSTNRSMVLTTASGSLEPAQGISVAHDTLTLSPAITAHVNARFDLFAAYDLALGLGKSVSNTIFGGARWNF